MRLEIAGTLVKDAAVGHQGLMVQEGFGRNLGWVVAVTAAMIFLYGKIDYGADRFRDWDWVAYRAMATASPRIAQDVSSPFTYRILGPWLVGLLPVSQPLAFYLVTVVASLALPALFYCYLCRFGIGASIAAFTTILFVFNKYLFGFTVWDYFQVSDVLSLICIVALFWAMFARRWDLFALLFFIGALTREACMIMLPTALAYSIEEGWTGTKGSNLLLASIPGLAVFVLLRTWVMPGGVTGLLEAFVDHAGNVRAAETWIRLIDSFAPLTAVPLVFLAASVTFFSRRKYAFVFAGLVLLSILFGDNRERRLAAAFVIFYHLVASIVQEEIFPNKSLLAALGVGAFAGSLSHSFARYPLPSRSLQLFFTAASLAFVTISCVIFRISRLHREGADGTLSR